MQIKTLIEDQTFILKELPVTPRIHNQISTSAAVCAPTSLEAFTPRQQGGIKLPLCIWAGKQHILQLQGALSFTGNIFKFLLGHLRQGKYSGHRAGGTEKQQLHIELHIWRPALQIRPMKIYCSAPNTQHYPVAPSKKLCYTKPECADFVIGLVEPTVTALLFSMYNTIFPKGGNKEAKKICSAAS